MSGRLLFIAWLASVLPAAAIVWLVEGSDREKAEFRRLAQGRAEGTIVGVEEERGKHIRFRPTVAFSSPAGEAVRFRSIYTEDFPPSRFRPGRQVPVVFIPGNAARAEIDDPRLQGDDGAAFRIAGGAWCAAMTLLFGGLAAAGLARRKSVAAAR